MTKFSLILEKMPGVFAFIFPLILFQLFFGEKS